MARIPNDNREFILQLEQTGDLVRIAQEVDWDLEIGAITRRVCELQAPAPLFERVRDYPGWRVLGVPLAHQRRFAVALGLSPDASVEELIDVYLERTQKLVEPVLVDAGPCQENVVIGEEVNLFDLPAPMVHDGDGGRYVSTWHLIVSKDPDTGWVNWGMYRQMIHNRQYMGGLCLPFSDMGRIFYGKYVPRNKPMPFATAIGCDPLSSLSAMIPIPVNVSEASFAGALRQAPVELVKCRTVDLEVPATAEVVIEGEMLPNVTVPEGPFGEYTGYRSSPRVPRNVYRVTAITYRKDPIFTVSNMGMPVDDSAAVMAITWASEVKKLLLSQGFPITGVYCPPFGVTLSIVVGIKRAYTNLARQVANFIFGTKFAGPWTNMVIVVDEDVNVYDLNEVFHALSTKCHPVKGIKIYDDCPGSPLTPFLSYEDRVWGNSAKVLFDCTWPVKWDQYRETPQKVSFNNVYPAEVREKVLQNWASYGFKTS